AGRHSGAAGAADAGHRCEAGPAHRHHLGHRRGRPRAHRREGHQGRARRAARSHSRRRRAAERAVDGRLADRRSDRSAAPGQRHHRRVNVQEALLDHFVTYLRAERNLSGKTVEAYAVDVRTYLEDLAKRGTAVEAATREDVLEHLALLRKRGLSARSSARHLAALRGFHKFLEDEKLAPKNPTEDLDTPRSAKKLPIFLSLQEVEALLAAPDERTVSGQRDRAMLEVLYATGLRVSELVGLKVADVNLTDGYLLAFGKGKKERVVPLGRMAKEKVELYLQG